MRVSVGATPGRAAWRGVDLASRRDWVYEPSADEIEELRAVVGRVRDAGFALDELRREDVPLRFLSPVIDGRADELDAGRGFVLVRGVPVSQNAAGDLTEAQVELLELIGALTQDPELHLDMDFEPGDIQWLANRTILHSRTAYEDDPARRRHLLRLWLTLHRNVVGGAGTGGIPVKTGSD